MILSSPLSATLHTNFKDLLSMSILSILTLKNWIFFFFLSFQILNLGFSCSCSICTENLWIHCRSDLELHCFCYILWIDDNLEGFVYSWKLGWFFFLEISDWGFVLGFRFCVCMCRMWGGVPCYSMEDPRIGF